MAVTLSLFAGAGAQFFDNNGNPLTGGKLYTYAAGTTTPLATYTTNSDASLHTNPIVLDAAGRVPSGGEIWLQLGVGYKFVLKTSTDVLIATYDNIPSSAQPPAANDADSIMYEQGYTVTAGSFVTGQIYRIVSVGTTDFTLIGAVANTVGLHFIATGAGTGTGTAELSRTVETKLREFVSVTDFGADPTGVSNSTAAIAAAFAASTKVSFPDGSYLMNSGVTVQANDIEVDFGNATIINGGASWTFTFGATSNTPQNSGLKVTGGYFIQSNPATTSNLNYIRVAGFSNFIIAGCNMKNVSNGGIYVEAGCENGLIDGVTINGESGYSTNRGIWLIGATASDFASQLVDTNSITRNATPVPVYAVKNVRITNCSIVLPSYGIYLMNARDTHIENCYIDISGVGASRCIAVNNYSPGAVVIGNTLISDRSSTGVLVTQVSDNVIISNNVFKGSFGGNRAVYVAYLASALISNNRFTDTTTQHIQVDMGGFAHVKNNEFVRAAKTNDNRAVFLTAIDNAQVNTAVGSTATVLSNSGVVFENNLLDRVCMGVLLKTDLAANNGNEPAVGICQVVGNTFMQMDLASTGSEFPLTINAGSGANVANARIERNVVYPYNVSDRNRAVSSGTALILEATTASLASFRVTVASGGGAITSTRLAGNNFSLNATRSGDNLILSPRTQLGASGASVPAIIGITNADGASAVRTFQVTQSGSNYTVSAYDAAGVQISFATSGVNFHVLLGPIAVGT